MVNFETLKKEYLSGMSLKQLGEKYNLDSSSIRWKLVYYGFKDFRKGHKGTNGLKGKKFTEEHKRNLSKSKTGSNNPQWEGGVSKLKGVCEYCGKKLEKPKCGRDKVRFCSNKCQIMFNNGAWNKGKKTPLEIVEKIAKKLRGRKLSKEHIRKISKTLTGRIRTKKEREGIRNGTIKRIERQVLNGEPMVPSVGLYETHILNLFENLFYPYSCLRQFRVAGYFLDGYFPALNLAIEIDEKYHNKDMQKMHDVERENYINKKINCNFLRINI